MALRKPRLIVIAGPNGSGKTSIMLGLREHAWMLGCEYINPDLIAFRKYGGWDSREAFHRAADEAEELRRSCLTERRDLAFETVFSTDEKVEFVRKAVAEDYFVRLFFICTDSPQINIARIKQRSMVGEHAVPETGLLPVTPNPSPAQPWSFPSLIVRMSTITRLRTPTRRRYFEPWKADCKKFTASLSIRGPSPSFAL